MLSMKFIAFCFINAGYKNYNNRYKKLVEKQSETHTLNKHQTDNHFTIDYINKLFGLEEKKEIENENASKEPKISFKDIFSQVIPKHLFQKPRKTIDYFKSYERIQTDGKNSIKTNENTQSMTDILKETSFLLKTPKTTFTKTTSEEEVSTIKKSFTLTTKKKKKYRLYEKETASFSAKINKKLFKSSTTMPINENTVKKPSFIIKTRIGEDNLWRKKEKSKTMNIITRTPIQSKTYLIKSKNEINKSREPKVKNFTEIATRSDNNFAFNRVPCNKFEFFN